MFGRGYQSDKALNFTIRNNTKDVIYPLCYKLTISPNKLSKESIRSSATSQNYLTKVIFRVITVPPASTLQMYIPLGMLAGTFQISG